MIENTLQSILDEVKMLKSMVNTLINQKLEKKEIDDNGFLSSKEASLYLNISKSHFYHLTFANVFPKYNPGGKLLYFKKSDLDNYLNNKTPYNKTNKEDVIKNQNNYNNYTLANELNITRAELRSFKINYKNLYNEKLPLGSTNGKYTENEYNIIKKAYYKFKNIDNEVTNE